MIVDANVWIAYYNTSDSCHKKAQKIVQEKLTEGEMLAIPVSIVAEVVSIFLHRKLYSEVDSILDIFLNHAQIVLIPEDSEHVSEIAKMIKNRAQKRRFSYQDLSVLLFAEQLQKKILSFDKKLCAFARRNKINVAA